VKIFAVAVLDNILFKPSPSNTIKSVQISGKVATKAILLFQKVTEIMTVFSTS